MNSNDREQEANAEIAKKTVEPVNEPSHEIVPGTIIKCNTLSVSKYYLMPPWHSPNILAPLKRSISRIR